ncbi:tetratricopeptide repeat protein [Butyrivibrio sp. AC2005]|uniref:tetratricopeptide repeat protein n=1 Tax=Butyrivibrio sp. AC2005 TaxID=1280672 RepID=UPI0004008728|nr:tetratricopeptide repeat protein [Butyrivibrio sp. AC2005]
MKDIPEILVKAQEMQKIGDYRLSMKLYRDFFENNSCHPLRFKALFEVADNYYHSGDYDSAQIGYNNFLDYCKGQSPSSDEIGWVKEYSKLARSRLKQINEKRH